MRSHGKTPYHIQRKDAQLFAFAGLYDIWKEPDGRESKAFAIVTTAANDLLAQVHNRMPVILKRLSRTDYGSKHRQKKLGRSWIPFNRSLPRSLRCIQFPERSTPRDMICLS